MNFTKYIYVLILTLLFSSCNPFISKDLRRKNKCNRKVEKEFKRRDKVKEKLKEKCPEAVVLDTIKIPFEVEVPKIQIKDSIQVEVIVDSVKVDSLSNVLNSILSREEKIKYVTEFIEDNFVLDTIIDTPIYRLRFQIKNGVLLHDITIKERKIKGEATALKEEVNKIELNPIEKLINCIGGMYWSALWILILVVIGYISYRKIFK